MKQDPINVLNSSMRLTTYKPDCLFQSRIENVRLAT